MIKDHVLKLYSSINFNYLSSVLNFKEYSSVINYFNNDYLSFFSDLRILKENERLKFYLFQYKEELKNIPFATKKQHTMDHALNWYILSKIPFSVVNDYIKNEFLIEIHGYFPTDFDLYHKLNNVELISKVDFNYFSTTKKFNFIRPGFFEMIKNNKKTLVILVPPGKDYIYHYTSFIKYFFYKLNKKIKNFFIFRYPLAEIRICDLTKLDENFVLRGDKVVISYVEEMRLRLQKEKRPVLISSFENQFYKSYRYRLKNNFVVNFLGVKYSFWGDISSKIVYRICKLGASEVIYIGKLGCLTKETDLYNKIFVPSIYFVMNQHRVMISINKIKNKLIDRFPFLNTYGHLSVPTVIEETYLQRKIAEQFSINSIDNEISQIAYSINRFNLINKKDVSFSALHFSTDYLRNENERGKFIKLNLSTNRTILAKMKKNKILDKIYSILSNYLDEAC
ncbi:MAG: hypothetical protein NZL96_02565 [Patescibacteria group bacterium]|nr:hypothetical protein [Patescibacteria group bacterium]